MTNGDMIRQMSDEELFDNYLYATECVDCDFKKECKSYRSGTDCSAECRERWMKWLSQESEEKPREHVGILPVPCTKVNETTVKDWFRKINEELDEFKEGLLLSDEPEELIFSDWAKDRYAEEAADTITAITSMLEAMGINEEMRQEAQERVNRKNEERGRL